MAESSFHKTSWIQGRFSPKHADMSSSEHICQPQINMPLLACFHGCD